MGIEPISLSFVAKDVPSSYKKALSYLSSLGEIEDKAQDVYIKAKSGSHVKARVKGFAMCDPRDLPASIRVDFVKNTIEVSDATGPGWKIGVSGRIKKNMAEIAEIIKKEIERLP